MFLFLLLFSLNTMAAAPGGCLNYINASDAIKMAQGYFLKEPKAGPFVCDSNDCVCIDGIDPEAMDVVSPATRGGQSFAFVNEKKLAEKQALVAAAKAKKLQDVADKQVNMVRIKELQAKKKDGSISLVEQQELLDKVLMTM